MATGIKPTAKSIADVKRHLLHPALTSLYYVEIDLPSKIGSGYMLKNLGRAYDQDRLNLMCCEATLPGSNLATLELTNDRTGVTERHAYRRVYDDRIDLTFYVDADNYTPIRVFETWIKYISQESQAQDNIKGSTESPNYFYSFQYPDNYMSEKGLKITKFEKNSLDDGGSNGVAKDGTLTYTFIRSFPISISSIPVSYDSSNLLKCTVSMSYIRYVVDRAEAPGEEISAGQGPVQGDPSNPYNFANNLGADAFSKVNLDSASLFKPGTQAFLNTNQAFNAGKGTYSFPASGGGTSGFSLSGPLL